jgi:hypothetical protein
MFSNLSTKDFVACILDEEEENSESQQKKRRRDFWVHPLNTQRKRVAEFFTLFKQIFSILSDDQGKFPRYIK